MKLLSLKTTFSLVLLFAGLTSMVAVKANQRPCPQEVQKAKHIYDEFGRIFHSCIFDKNDKNPFSHFIYRVTTLANQHKNELSHCIPVAVLERFIVDLHKSLQMHRSVANKTQAALKIGLVFKKYQKHLPPALQKISVAQFLSGLRFRLSIPDTAAAPAKC